MGAAGVASGPSILYVEDVFSTWTYTGNGGTQTITNELQLSSKGGLAWVKSRSSTTSHILVDSARGDNKGLLANANIEQQQFAGSENQILLGSSGFTVATSGPGGSVNVSGQTYVGWAFRKAAKFFDVVTYTGNGSNRTIAHNLGSVPGCIIVKRTDIAADWQVYHRSLANTEYLVLNSTAAKATGATRWNSTTPTSTVFSLGTDVSVNASGGTYVAYLFAHDAGGFGATETDNIVSCGTYTGNGSATGPVINLGWEPQWLLVKRASLGGVGWSLVDNMRGFVSGSGNDALLQPNVADAEVSANFVAPLATGFQPEVSGGDFNSSGQTYIYIAIRRGPMKTPTDATKVFTVFTYTGDGASRVLSTSGVVPDSVNVLSRNINGIKSLFDRLRGADRSLSTYDTAAETAYIDSLFFDNQNLRLGADTNYTAVNSPVRNFVAHVFRRAPGFFDVVAYTGTGSARTVAHNLGVAPELMIVKSRNLAEQWYTYNYTIGATNSVFVNLNWASTGPSAAAWNNTAPTNTVFTVGTDNGVNGNGSTYIAYLFASCPGVSKVGSYTGTGTTLNVDCGFTAGARFVLIKRTNSTGDWYVWDTARGIIAANDPYLLLNSTAAEVTNTDYIDPLAAGFQISSTAPAAINANGGTYIYLAIA